MILSEKINWPLLSICFKSFNPLFYYPYSSCFGDPVVAVNAIMGGIISQEIIQVSFPPVNCYTSSFA